MRVLLGIVIGVFLTVAGAFAYDSIRAGGTDAGAAAGTSKPMVNWDVVDNDLHVLTARVRHAWNRLSAG